MNLTWPHNIKPEQAKKRLDHLVDSALEKGGGKVSESSSRWENDTLYFSTEVSGHRITGTATVTVVSIILQVKLPWFAKPLETQIRQQIERELSVQFP